MELLRIRKAACYDKRGKGAWYHAAVSTVLEISLITGCFDQNNRLSAIALSGCGWYQIGCLDNTYSKTKD